MNSTIPDCLARNLSALALFNPDVVKAIQDLKPDGRYQFVRSAAGWPVPVDEARGGVPLGSLRDPLDDCRNDIRPSAPQDRCSSVFWGFGSGYSFLAACLELGDRMTAALIVEPDPALFRAVLSVLDLSRVLKSPGLRVVLGCDIGEVEKKALELLPHLLGSKRFTVRDSHSWRRYGRYLAQAEQRVGHVVERAHAEARFLSRYGRQIQENIWRNAPLALAGPVLGHFAGFFSGAPAVLISAGPSLARDLPQVAALPSLPLVVAVDTAYPVLQRAGIEPDIVVTCDPTPLNMRHFEASEPTGVPILVFDPEVYWEIPPSWPGDRIVLNAGESPTAAWFRHLSGEHLPIRKPISVVHAALEVAISLGCEPIVLLGSDFSYNATGGESHVKGAVLGRTHGPIVPDQECLDLSGKEESERTVTESLVWLPGKRGGRVPASNSLAMFAAQFERRAAESGRRILDAGSSGARLDGTECVSFEEIRRLLASVPIDRSCLSGAIKNWRPTNCIDLRGVSEEALGALERVSSRAREGIARCNQSRVDATRSAGVMEDIFWSIRHDPGFGRVFGHALYAATLPLISQPESPRWRAHLFTSFFHAVLEARDQLYPAIRAVSEQSHLSRDWARGR